MLIIFNPTRTAAAHPPPAARHLIDPEDADELAQILYPLPTTKDALNLILGTMGTAKGIMAFSQSLAHAGTPQSAFHSIKTAKKRTVIYQPQRDTLLLVVFPADSRIPESMVEETVRTAWDTAILLFGPEPWNEAATEWWQGFEGRIGDSVEQGGMKGWVSGGAVADFESDDRHDGQGVTMQLESFQDLVTESIAPITASYAICLPESTNPTTDRNPTIYQSPSTAHRTRTRNPLIHHLLDLLHTAQPRTSATPTTARNRQRSPPSAEKPHHQTSKWTTLSLGTGISLFPVSRATTPSAPTSSLPANPKTDPKPKSIASWFGLGSSTPPSQDRPAITEDPIPITPVDVPALDEALGSAQPVDVRWNVREVFLPGGDEDAQQADGLVVRRVLAYAVHARTLVAFILHPSTDQQLPDLSAHLNDPSSTAIQSALSDLIRATQAPLSERTDTPSPSGTQYIHSTSHPARFTSNWKARELVSAPTKEPSTSTRSRPRREVTVDSLGVSARVALISIDDAREIFARTGNDVWIVGSRSCSEGDGKEVEGDEAYVIVQGREASIVDAEFQLRKILKAQM